MTLTTTYRIETSFREQLGDRPGMRAVSDGAGGFVAVSNHGASGNLELSFHPEGRGAASNSVIFNGLSNPSIARLSNGTYLVAAQDADSIAVGLGNGGYVIAGADQVSATNSDVELRFFNAAGTQVFTRIVDTGAGNEREPEMAVLSNGNVAVTWMRKGEGFADSQVFYAIYSPTGAVVKAPTQLTGTGDDNNAPDIAATATGFVLVTETRAPNGFADLSITDFTLSGTVLNSRIESPAGRFATLSSPSVTVLPNGFLLISADGSETGGILLLDDTPGRAVAASGFSTVGDPTSIVNLGGGIAYHSASQTDFFTGETTTSGQAVQAVRLVTGDAANDVWAGDSLRSIVRAGGGADQLTGGSGAETLQGEAGDDVISGGGGDDLLTGGAGDDTLTGGTGNDTADYLFAAGGIRVRLDLGITTTDGDGGDDTLIGIENVRGTRFDDLIFGDAGANILSGDGGSDTLRGLGGNDILDGGVNSGSGVGDVNTLIGGTGDDLYRVRPDDIIIELAGEGVDTVEAELTAFVLADNVENLIFVGGFSEQRTGTGNGAANRLVGDIGDDILRGLGGIDRLEGGEGLDTADYSLAGSAVSADIALQRSSKDGDGASDVFVSIENLTGSDFDDLLFGDGQTNVLRGGGGADVLRGQSGDDVLAGGAGADRLDGGNGVDTADYSLAAGGVRAQLNSNTAANDGDGGADVLVSIENLTGSAFNDLLIGDASENVLRGGTGADTLLGLAGADVLIGGAGAANTLQGGAGNDVYLVGAVGDSITELAGEGVDEVQTALGAFTLAANVENLTFTDEILGAPFVGVGNASDNVIRAGLGVATLRGLGGNDVLAGGDGGINTLIGGVGDDRYVLRNSDVVVELAGEGVDTVELWFNAHEMAGNVENVEVAGFSARVTGNALANRIIGGVGGDLIRGGGGADVLNGADGDDVAAYDQAAAGVTVRLDIMRAVNDGDGASDTLISIENLFGSAFNDLLIGDGGDNVLRGELGADVLMGGAGDDTLVGGSGASNELYGGLGNDLYVLTANDSIIEQAGQGIDTVDTNLAVHALGANVENLTFLSGGEHIGTGNALDNVLTGSFGNDTLRGRGGVDVLNGDSGQDIADYAFATAGVHARLDLMRAINDGDGGTDTYVSIEGIQGSAFNDLLVGGALGDRLSGGLGADTLLGFDGADTLSGGQGVANTLQGG
ncbi:MAG: calcium-binding protein, partial [Brevundimonas sp.]